MGLARYAGKRIRKSVLKKIDTTIDTSLTSINPLFDVWERISMATKTPLPVPGSIIQAMKPTVLPTGLPYIDGLISRDVEGDTGIPFGSWIILTGAPGAGKTTLGLLLLNALGKNPKVESIHYDYEMTSFPAKEMYRNLGIVNIKEYIEEPDSSTLLSVIEQRAENLATQGKSLVVLIDSFKAFGTTINEMREAAERIKDIRKHKNLLIITVNHFTKTKSIEGPAGIQQWCDVMIEMRREGKYFKIGTPTKNRHPVDESVEFKLLRSENGYEISNVPDFITSNPVVGVLGRMKLFQKKK